MLTKLTVNNFALIRELEMKLDNSLNIITGETGAGKSILLGALGLILGERANTSVLPNNNEKTVVEGTFTISAYKLKPFFEANDLDYDEQTILRREINQSGKSRAFVNDTPVPLTVLKELGEKLVDIHSQHETLSLNDKLFQLKVVDAFAGNETLLLDYKKVFREYKATERQLNELKEREQEATKEKDYKQFLYDELNEAGLQEGEDAQLEEELDTLTNAEDIQQACYSSANALSEAEISVIDQLNEIKSSLAGVAKFNKTIQDLVTRLDGDIIDLKELSGELNDIGESTTADPARLEEVNSRLQLIHNLLKKHHVTEVASLLEIQEQLSVDLDGIGSLEKEIVATENKRRELHQEAANLANQLSTARQGKFKDIETKVGSLLASVGMPNAQIKIEHIQLSVDQLNLNGRDDINLLFSSNLGTPFLPLNKVASGGELSRLMLCIKSQIADKTALPTIIFDEIDTGVSGEVAQKVGEIMKGLAGNHQVVTITHLPQIAAKGLAHFFVYKQVEGNTTNTHIRQLTSEERTVEIAKMLSGENPTETAIANAKELLVFNN